jgi:hypothetical protein
MPEVENLHGTPRKSAAKRPAYSRRQNSEFSAFPDARQTAGTPGGNSERGTQCVEPGAAAAIQ